MQVEKLVRKGVLNLETYIPGKPIEEVERQYGAKRWIKLASNENLLGPSPKALSAIRKELKNLNLYPEGSCSFLRDALAKKFSLKADEVVVSNGADNLIVMIGEAFVDEGDEVVIADPTFPVYSNVALVMGGVPVKIGLKDFTHDLDRMLEAVNARTKIVFICNPNNPTGTIVSRKALENFLSRLPERIIVVIDEAYCDFVVSPDFPDSSEYIRSGRHVIVLRTFSKVYGLAGVRLGFALAPRGLIECLNRVREPFPVHRLAQVAGLAALEDRGHVMRSIEAVKKGREYLYREFEKLGLSYIPSQANFVLVDFKRDSREVFEALLKEGIIIRPGFVWKYDTFARVTVGRMSDNRKFIKALRKIFRGD